jgi:hypothetical protein
MRYYGARIASANTLLSGQAKMYMQSGYDVMWFTSEPEVLQFCNKCLEHRIDSQTRTPELFEQEATTLPGVAYIWIENELPDAMSKPKEAVFVYCPPPQAFPIEISQSQKFLYNTGLHQWTLPKIVAAYQKDMTLQLPDGYKPILVPSDVPFVHYGTTTFDKQMFKPVQSIPQHAKPGGGFWGSPICTENSWNAWCKREEYNEYNPNQRVEFYCKPDSKVFQIDTLDDITFLIKNYPAPYNPYMMPYGSYMEYGLPYLGIDYEAMSKDFDGICYNYTELGNILGPWDCDSIVIFNPDIMEFRDIVLYPEDFSPNDMNIDDNDER